MKVERVVQPRMARWALVVLLLVNVEWGGSMPATKVGLTEFSPLLLAWLRLAVSALFFLAILAPRPELRALRHRDLLRLIGLGVIGYGGTIGLQTIGTGGTTAAHAAVLGSAGPFFIAVLAPVVLAEHLSRRTLAGLVIAMVGVVLVLGVDPRDLAHLDLGQVAGDLLVLASSACFAVFAVLGKRATKNLASPLLVSGVSTVGGAVVLALPAWWETGGQPPHPGLLGWAMVGYLGIIVTGVGMLGWFWALRLVPASRAAAFLFVQPLSGIALAAVLLGDRLSPTFLLGTALVLGALYLIGDS